MSKRSKTEKARYINPFTDFGFKRIFGTEANKDLLIDFLNAVLDIDGEIIDLRYDNPERQGRVEIDRRAIFDLYCITGKGEHIIVEMQNVRQDYFRDRALYYASFPIQDQGEKGRNWDFQLTPVYSVNMLNFTFEEKSETEKQYLYHVQLIDKISNRVFIDKLLFVFLELPNFTKAEHELKTDFEGWMYVLKHLAGLQELPYALRNRIFEKLFHVAEIAKMSPKEKKSYNQSLKEYRDMYLMENALKKKEALLQEKENVIQGMHGEIQVMHVLIQGKDAVIQEKDIALKKKDETMIRVLLEAGLSVEKIAETTGLSMTEINRIKDSL
jgi:predicted transposase/invertase (TIGR01784 family)